MIILQDTNQLPKKIIQSFIHKFYNKTGVPVLLNTSFNGPSEPIVETPLDAINTFLETNLDILVINNIVIIRE